MDFLQRSLSHRRLFLELLWLRSIGTPSGMLKDAYGTKIGVWIELELWKQFLSFLENFQIWQWFCNATCSLLASGLWCSTCMECFRLKTLHKIHVHNDFTYLILENLFQSFFMLFLFNHDPITPKLAYLRLTRNIELIMCMKRFF